MVVIKQITNLLSIFTINTPQFIIGYYFCLNYFLLNLIPMPFDDDQLDATTACVIISDSDGVTIIFIISQPPELPIYVWRLLEPNISLVFFL